MEYAAPPAPTPEIVSAFAGYREQYDTKPVTFDNVANLKDVVEIMRTYLDEHRPFSMARLGDGEGACLFYDTPEFANLAVFSIWRTLSLHFGHQAYTEQDFTFFNEEMKAAVATADLVTFARNPLVYKRLTQAPETNDIRGYVGATFANHIVSNLPNRDKKIIYEDGYLHVGLLPYYADLLKHQKVVIVSSAGDAFCDILSDHFDFELVRNITIPNQSVNTGQAVGNFLYPNHFGALRAELKAIAKPGLVFVMAAGLVTKFLCQDVQARGAFALDVGSVMDVWQGKGVRTYQSEDFVNKYKIQP